MNTKAKSNSIITTKVDGNLITFNVLGAGSMVLDLFAVSEENRLYAATHGLVQRVSDKAAIPRDERTGLSATPQEKFDAMLGLVNHLNSGSKDWNMTRAGGGGARVKVWAVEDMLLALATVLGKNIDDDFIAKIAKAAADKGETKEVYLRNLAGAQAVDNELCRMERSRIVPKLDSDAELAELQSFTA